MRAAMLALIKSKTGEVGMDDKLLSALGNELIAAAIAVLLVGGYQLFLHLRLRKDPLYTVQGVNALARAQWVQAVMADGKKDVLAVQTLRNSIMGPTFLASTAVLLIIGTLTLTGQASDLSSVWHVLNIAGLRYSETFAIKLAILLFDFFVAFFAFAMAIRMFIHVGYMVNVPEALQHRDITPRYVAFHLNRAGRYHTIGMRAYYYSVPLLFWLFGPHLLVIASAALVVLMYRMDRAPKIDASKPLEPSD